MKYVKLFEQWTEVQEKMGISDAVAAYVPIIAKSIVDNVKQRLDSEKLNPYVPTEMKFVVPGKGLDREDFPIDHIDIVFTVKPDVLMSLGKLTKLFSPDNDRSEEGEMSGDEEVNLMGSFDGQSLKVADGKVSFTVRFEGEMDIMKLAELLSSGLSSKFKEMIHNYLQHEMTHAYEQYRRHIGKKYSDLGDTKDFIYDSVSKMINMQNNLPDILSDFLFDVYCAASYEINARVAEAGDIVRKYKEPHKRWDEMKKTYIWKIAQHLEDFSADSIYANMFAQVVGTEEDDHKVTPERAREILDNLMRQISAGFIEKNKFMLDKIKNTHDIELSDQNVKLVSNMLTRHGSEFEKVGHMDAQHFFRFWEKKFHRAGDKLKEKLEKLTTYYV